MKLASDMTVIRPDLRFRFDTKKSRASAAFALPMLLFVLIGLFRQGLLGSLGILGFVVLILGAGYIWLRFCHTIIVGPGMVRVRWGLRTKTFHSASDLAVVRLSQISASIMTTADPKTVWLFLGQQKQHATLAYINSKDSTLIFRALGNPQPFEAVAMPNGALLEKPTGAYARALPLWIRRPGLFAVIFAIVITAVISVCAIVYIHYANNAYRQDATVRLEQAAGKFTGTDWHPSSSPDIHWTSDSDHSSLSLARTYAVPYRTNDEFIAGWDKLTNDNDPLHHPLCEKTDNRYYSCYGTGYTYIHGTYVTAVAEYSYLLDDSGQVVSGPRIELTIEDSRDN